jgi:predicted lipoprotein with Yx(FWY)xxD motif
MSNVLALAIALGSALVLSACAANWPLLMVADTAKASGDYTIITRDDGKMQWALKGKPLCYWAEDQKPGDRTGDGFNNVWRVARE